LSKSKTHATFAPTKARNYKGASDHSKGSNNKENYSGGIAHFKGFHSKQLANFIRQLSKKKGKVGLVSAELKPSHERGEHPMEGPQKGDATRRSCFCTFSTRVSRDELPTPEVRRDFLYEISGHKLRLFDSLIFFLGRGGRQMRQDCAPVENLHSLSGAILTGDLRRSEN
jgi:hypothetical protein